MIVIENNNAELVLKHLIPPSIVELNPIIAGGFVVALFENCIFNDNSSEIISVIEDLKKPFAFRRSNVGNLKRALNFGDIDFWITKDAFLNSEDLYKTYYDFLEEYLLRNSNLYPSHESRWAKTFYYSNQGINLIMQMIKRPATSVEEILNGFDIVNCQAAYHNGKFYFSEAFYDSFINKNIELNESRDIFGSDNGFLLRIWTANRVFKYAKRFNLQPSKELIQELVKLFFKAEEIMEGIKELGIDSVIKLTEEEVENFNKNTSYGPEALTSHFVTTQIEELFSNALDLFTFKNIEDHTVLYFMGFKSKIVYDALDKFLQIKDCLGDINSVNSDMPDANSDVIELF